MKAAIGDSKTERNDSLEHCLLLLLLVMGLSLCLLLSVMVLMGLDEVGSLLLGCSCCSCGRCCCRGCRCCSTAALGGAMFASAALTGRSVMIVSIAVGRVLASL